MVIGKGSPDSILTESDVKSIIGQGTPENLFRNKRVLVLTPDATRTCPLPLMVRSIREIIGRHCSRLDFMVALGTHPPMPEAAIRSLYGIADPTDGMDHTALYNHEWNRPDIFHRVGTLPAGEVEALSDGLLREAVEIDINRRIYDYDLILIAGPVFPHEVVGFSGGAKYLFPGISGGEFLHFTHWLGAVITCARIIGIEDTPVRRLIHRAAEKIPVPIHCLAMVVNHTSGLCGLYAGNIQEAWSRAARLSSKIHIVTRKRPFRLVLGNAPSMYDEIWTAGKVMYKLEQVVADGGTLIIHAPHIREVSSTWGAMIEKTGYHVRDYFLSRMDRFRDVPRGVLAHSTHVRGTGTYRNGIETPRIDVVLATSIPAETCRRINLGYMDPDTIRISDYVGREDEGILFVDHAGEILYRLDNP
jgi:nickel-dependent lactate racemase